MAVVEQDSPPRASAQPEQQQRYLAPPPPPPPLRYQQQQQQQQQHHHHHHHHQDVNYQREHAYEPYEPGIQQEQESEPDSQFSEKDANASDEEKAYIVPVQSIHSVDPNSSDNHHSSSSGDMGPETQFHDDLELLRAEQLASDEQNFDSKSKGRVHNPEPEDAFNQINHDVVMEKKRNKDAALYKLWTFLRKFPRFIRYIIYLIPGAALLLIPVLLGLYRYQNGQRAVGGVGGVYVMWFGIWLEIVWCSLWVSRMITNLMPSIFHGVAKVAGSLNAKKWRDIGQRLELHTALFLWLLAVLISFKPLVNNHRVPVPDDQKKNVHMQWISVVNHVIIALFVMATLNWLEKILIQWIATSFHQRTYATRIENNRADTRLLYKLFEHARNRPGNGSGFWKSEPHGFNGAQTPLKIFHNNARQVLGRVGHVAGKVGNDLIGRKVNPDRAASVVNELLRNTASAHSLARILYRSVVSEGRSTVLVEDLRKVFSNPEDVDVDAAFSMFDKDMNGDISIEEFETVCNEIHLERKAIAASLKDLDSVIQKLDRVFCFMIVVVSVIVFISILSDSAAAGLASAGTSFLGLAWMLQATAQEFLQSIIFVFIKHPFDVGDRVTIYGSTGATLTGDDYYVTEISLLYTEFKKMQGHIVQAPNSILNTLFILNQRRSNGLSDSIPLQMRFGTHPDLIEELKARMLEFVKSHKRDYQPNIITEMTTFDQVRSCTMNIVFFHKSNFQNELLRLNRHNKFATELMYQMVQVGIESPFRVEPGGSRDYPMHWSNIPASSQAKPPETQQPPFPPTAVRSKRAFSIRSERSVPNTEGAMGGFQDVYENRREHLALQRMESIREKERGSREEEQAEAAPRTSMTSALQATRSAGSQSRNRIFGRSRSRTVGSQRTEIV